MEVRVCRACGLTKGLKSFGVNNSLSSGYSSRCKLCVMDGVKIVRPEKEPNLTPSERLSLNLAFITKEDYINTFKALRIMGYDLTSELNIHQQFCKKYGLTPLKRKPVGKTIWTKEELIDFL
jgi:hypothetical protein